MSPRRKIIVYIAASADGYIARPDGDVSWLDRGRPPEAYGTAEFMESVDTILWGRKTYEKALDMGGGFDPDVRNYVFTRRPPEQGPPGVEFVSEPVGEFGERVRTAPGKDIWMMGGGELIASFLDAGQIDELIVHVMPILIGDGIPLVAPRHGDVALDLLSSYAYDEGVLRLHYAVERPGGETDEPAPAGEGAGETAERQAGPEE